MLNRNLQVCLVLAIGFVAFFGVTPKIIGLGIRDATVTNLINLVPPESQEQLSITETQFNNGWFRSTAIVDIGVTSLDLNEPIGIRLNFDIKHGPFFLTDNGPQFGLAYAQIIPGFNNPDLTKAFTQIPFDLPTTEISMLAAFDQSLEVMLDVSPMEYTQNGTVVSFAGMNGSFIANADLSAQLTLSFGTMLAQDKSSQFGINLAGVEVETNTEQMNNLLAPSTVLLAIPAISSTGPFPFNVSNMSSNSRMQASTIPQAVDIYQNLRVENIESELPVQSLSWTTELNEIQNELFRSYYKLIGEIQSQINSNPNATMATAGQFGEDMAVLLIQNSLVLNNLVQANVYGGDHTVDIQIDWEGIPGRNNLDNPQFKEIANALAIRLEVTLDEAAIMGSQFAQLVDPYVQQGYLNVQNGQISLSAVLANGELTVNGEEVPLDQFF